MFRSLPHANIIHCKCNGKFECAMGCVDSVNWNDHDEMLDWTGLELNGTTGIDRDSAATGVSDF